MRQRASTHLLILLFLLLLNGLAYLAIHRGGLERGYTPSIQLAIAHLLLYLPLMGILIWLARRRRYQGDWTLLTVAVLLFGIGQFMQYRLFTDPEYRADNRRNFVRKAREAKADTIRMQSINQFYDGEKKRALFRDPNYQIPVKDQGEVVSGGEELKMDWKLILASILKPLLALAGMVLAILLFAQDRTLLGLQRKSFVLGLLTILSFIPLALLSSRGKFYGSTTPWEPVKVAFLASYSGILADHYRKLSQTRWGLPPWRFLLPLLMIAAMPVAAFLLLEDFGQLLVFLGVYLTLYLIAVRRIPQLTMALILVGLLLGLSVLGLGIYSRMTMVPAGGMVAGEVDGQALVKRMRNVVSQGIPLRIHQRFHLWLNGGDPPNPETQWWWPESRVRGFGSKDLRKVEVIFNEDKSNNQELWYKSFAFQPLQALFGISSGRLLGKGLGRGYPESVPIADSDFIYAALAEEMGLVGGAVVLVAFLLLVMAGVRVAIEAPDMFTKLLAAGITAFLGFQAIVNIGGVTRMLPMTGITLPFVSHGGWSLLTTFTMLGILMAISHRNRTI
jgi:cell division protein FtsW (lipid II flippase)